jgi:cytochrome c-type biogenesis protein
MLTDGPRGRDTIAAMDDISALSYPVAFAAGFVSFASPCVLALVPGYLTFISGVSFDELGSRTRDVMAPTLAFVLGFSLMFTAYGASAGLVGYSLTRNQDELNLIAGSLLIAMGIAMVAFPRLGVLQADRRLATARRPTTLVGAGLVGAAFAVGWTPCIGPILGSILTYAAPTGSPGLGATLLFTYSLGLGIPFLLSGLFLTRTMAAFRWMRDRWTYINAGAAVVFVAIGVLVATGRFEIITQQLSGVGFSGI